jgi:hypothetical protein
LEKSSIHTEFDQIIEAPAPPDSEFTLERVLLSAEYDVVVEELPPSTYIRSMPSGGRNILAGKARLTPGQRLQIAIGQATDDLEVHAYHGRDPSAGVQVVLIPEPLYSRRPDRYITGVTDEDGKVTLVGVPAGRYTAYAFEQIERGAYYAFGYNPAVQTRFADHAVIVTVGDARPRPIEVSVIPAADTAGGFN